MKGECMRGYGATAARLTPDQKVGSSNLSGLIFRNPIFTVKTREILKQRETQCEGNHFISAKPKNYKQGFVSW